MILYAAIHSALSLLRLHSFMSFCIKALLETSLYLGSRLAISSFFLQAKAICVRHELPYSYCYQDESLSSPNWVSFHRRQGFNRQNEGTGNINTSQQRANGSPNPSPTTFSPTMPPLNQSSSYSSSTGPSSDSAVNNTEQPTAADSPKFFFREKFAKLGVKGNFMPLAAQPANVDLADWLAHQSL